MNFKEWIPLIVRNWLYKNFENEFKQEMTVEGGTISILVTFGKEIAFASRSCMVFLLWDIWRGNSWGFMLSRSKQGTP